jgi:predicted nucleic acid-binding protein
VLVDTSAWIDFFRKKDPCYRLVNKLLADDRICCAGLVLGELMQGARSDRETSVIREFLTVFPFLSESTATWEQAGSLAFRLRRQGTTVGLSDCLLAVLAKANEASLLTLDTHFIMIRSELPVDLVQLD